MIIRQCIFLILVELSFALDCFRNTIDFDSQVQYCNPAQFPYCLKADSFDGNVYRNCASMDQCPQGPTCAQITYDEDRTTDYVCCCTTPLCNSSPKNFTVMTLFISLIVFVFKRL